MSDFIKDDTQLTNLADETGFQSFDRTDPDAVEQFADELRGHDLEKRTIYQNPYFKVGIGISVAFFILGFGFLLSLGENSKKQTTEEPEVEATDLTLSLEDGQESSTIARNPSDAEVDALQSELALLRQQLELAQVDRNDQLGVEGQPPGQSRQSTQPDSFATATTPTPTPSSVARPPTAVRPSTASTTPPRQTTPAAPSRTVRPSATAAPRQPARATPAPVAPTTAQPRFSDRGEEESLNPNEQWYAVSHSGVHGIVPFNEPEEIAQAEPVSAGVAAEVAPAGPQYQLKGEGASPVGQLASNTQPATAIPGLVNTSPDAVSNQVLMGQRARGRVSTAIAWLNPEAQYLIELEDDIAYRNNTVAIPAGSYIVVQPVAVNSDNGYAELAVVGMMIDGQPIPISYGLINVNGEDGEPLIAERYGDIGGAIARSDIELFVVGALANVGEVLNRPEQQSTSTGPFGGTQQTVNGDANVFGAVLEGGAEQIADRMEDRNDDRYDEIRDREQIFFLEEGYEVEIYINQEFSL
ncbi:MAG: hypothetical protein AAFW84_09855 [Cyanobacteria bacterium J06635_15]